MKRLTMRGHRTVPYTADTRVEAWAPTPGDCIAEAVLGMTGSFLDLDGVAPISCHELHIEPGKPEDQLVTALDEAIYLMDTTGQIPIDVAASQDRAGLTLRLVMADLAATSQIGAVPKAVTLNQLTFEHGAGQWTCAVTLDV
ncbi:archease [Streptosporangium sp. NPDC000396]|uniref:archease n=1 Tax=Streptosporangium sp. NPDC000396 TaxID=3366185 RepID=UPI0036CEE942